ncbi:MAG: hypothetical protein K2M39_04205 [Muribaculaceae bacterium]|nr:hypothetical protein [Muribaculaceae bacterium]
MKKIVLTLLSVLFPLVALSGVTEEIASLREAADSLHGVGKTDSAVIVGERAIRLAEKSGDKVQMVGTFAGQGVYLRSLGRIDEALKSYEKGLEIVTSGEIRRDPSGEAIEEVSTLYINLAVLNLDMQHKEEAAKNALLSAEWCEKSTDKEFKSTVFGVVGSVLTGCGDLENALKFQTLAYKNALESGDEEAAFRAAAYNMLVADRLGSKSEANRWREKCEILLPSIDSMMAKLVYYQAECSICLKENDSKGSLLWFNKILELDGIDHLPFVKFDVYNNMHIAYAGIGDYERAYSTLLKSNELRDSLWEQEKAESLRELTVKYETKETQLALAQSEAKRAGVLMWLFAVIGLLLTVAVIFIIYIGRQRRRRMQKEIEFARLREETSRQLTVQYIKGLEGERARIAKELHDGVCNDLLAVQMNMQNGRSAEETAALIDYCRDSVRRISHELMPPEFAYATIDEVVRYLVFKQSEANKEKISFRYSSNSLNREWADIPDATSLEIYRIAQEAIGNAVKHSCATEITVELYLKEDAITLIVSDNGKFKRPGDKGIGMESIRKRANSINGFIEINTTSDGGTQLILVVKN